VSPPDPSEKKIKVLVVDDDKDVLRMAQRFLEAKGLEVVVCDSPFAAGPTVTREQPDVVVLDVMMPALSGDKLAVFIGDSGPKTPVIIFYSASDADRLQEIKNRFPGSSAVEKTAGLAALLRAVEEAAGDAG